MRVGKDEYSLSFFINTTGSIPNFVYPIFSLDETKNEFVAEAKGLRIKNFVDIGKDNRKKYRSIKTSESVCLSPISNYSNNIIDSEMIYAIEFKRNTVVYGVAGDIISYIYKTYYSDEKTDELWLKQAKKFINKIGKDIGENYDEKLKLVENKKSIKEQSNHEQKIKLLMTETSPELCRLCRETLPAQNIEVFVCPRNGVAAYSELVHHKPHAVLLDVFMPGMDAFAIKEKYNQNYPDVKTDFYVTGTFQHDDIERELMDSGFSFYFMKPFDVNVLARRLHGSDAFAGDEAARIGSATSAEDMVTDMLRSIGVPAHIKGYRFLRDAILMVVDDPGKLNAITKELYPDVAIKNDTSATRVERAIRHGIEVAWDRGDLETLNYYFGSTIHSLRGKPTNSEFIAMLSDRFTLINKTLG